MAGGVPLGLFSTIYVNLSCPDLQNYTFFPGTPAHAALRHAGDICLVFKGPP